MATLALLGAFAAFVGYVRRTWPRTDPFAPQDRRQ